MEIEPAELAHLPLNSFEENASTPVVDDDDWRGIEIRTASRVLYEAAERPLVPVAGFAMLDVPLEPHEEPMVLHAQTADGTVFAGAILDLDESPIVPPKNMAPLTPEDVEGLAVSQCFNSDLVTVCELPRMSGTLSVWVEYRGMRSNTTTVELIELPPEEA